METIAYIDPGAGTLLVQILLAGLIGATAFFRGTLGRLAGVFRKKESTDTKDPLA